MNQPAMMVFPDGSLATASAWTDEPLWGGVIVLTQSTDTPVTTALLTVTLFVAELRWFAPDEIPDEELAFAHFRDLLSTWREQHS